MFRVAEERALPETAMKTINTRILWRTAAALLTGCAGLALLTWILVASDFSHPATGALLYIIVIVLVSMTGNIASGIGLAIPQCRTATPAQRALGMGASHSEPIC